MGGTMMDLIEARRIVSEAGLTDISPALLQRALTMGGGSAPAPRPASVQTAGVDRRKYKLVGKLAGRYALWRRPGRNRVFMLTFDGSPTARVSKLMSGGRVIAKLRPGSAPGGGASRVEFQLDHTVMSHLLMLNADGALSSVRAR